jgi:hypothetical protein
MIINDEKEIFMKKLLLALSAFGLFAFNAEAKGNKNAKNYKICLVNDTYQVCDKASNKIAKVGREVKTDNSGASLRMLDSYTHLGYGSNVSSNRNNPRIRVSIDDPMAPYEGKESMVNDGVQKNISRNINYLDASIDLPPVNGSSGARR